MSLHTVMTSRFLSNLSKSISLMRTVEFINHLRSRDRNNLLIKVQLRNLDSARQIHLIGELANWLAADLRRYRTQLQAAQGASNQTNSSQKKRTEDNSTPGTINEGSRTTQLKSLQSQIRYSLLAILTILDDTGLQDHDNMNVEKLPAGVTNNGQGGSSNPKAVVMDSKDKARVLKNLMDSTLSCLHPMLPGNDPRITQIPSAKILYSLTYNSLHHPKGEDASPKRALFDPEQVLEALRTAGSLAPSLSLVSGIRALLSSPDTHLRECALRILMAYRQQDKTNALLWEVIGDLKPIVQELTVGIEATMKAAYKDLEPEVDDGSQEEYDLPDQGQSAVFRSTKYSKVLFLILHLMREAGSKDMPRTTTTDTLSTTSPPSALMERFVNSQELRTSSAANLNNLRNQDSSFGSLESRIVKLKEAVPLPILIDLWAAIQHAIVLGYSQLKITDELVQTTTALVYWAYWIYGKEAAEYMTGKGAATLLAWYGYVIVADEAGTSSGIDTDPTLVEEDDTLKPRSAILEYLARLLQNLVKARSLQDQNGRTVESAVFAGTKPLGIIIVRRTIEFLENILDSAIPTSKPELDPADYLDLEPTSVSYASRLIQLKPTILEAMLDLTLTCFGRLWEVDELVLRSRSLDLLLLLTSNLDGLFGIREQKRKPQSSQSQQTCSHRIQKLALRLIYQILRHDQRRLNVRIADIPLTHWQIGYEALVNIIIEPLDEAVGLGLDTGMETDTYSEAMRPTNGEGRGVMSTTDTRAKDTTTLGNDDNGVWALRVLRLLWRNHPKGHPIISDLLGPRLFKIQMIRVIYPPRTTEASPPILLAGQGTGSPVLRRTPRVGVERTKLLLEMMTLFGTESSVRINMRESWSSLLFIAMLLAASVKHLESKSYTDMDALDRIIVQSCLQALKNFYFDRLGLLRMIELGTVATLSYEERLILEDYSITNLLCSFSSPAPAHPMDAEARPAKTQMLSIVPVLMAILGPPKSPWDVDIMLQEPEKRMKQHPFFEDAEPFLIDAAVVMNQLSQFVECQQMLITKPGVIWTLTRMMVERSLVTFYQEQMDNHEDSCSGKRKSSIGFSTLCTPMKADGTARTRSCDDEEMPHAEDGNAKERCTKYNSERASPSEMLERTILEILTKVVSSMELAKSLVSNNTLTELYSAILDIDIPLYFYSGKNLPKEIFTSASKEQGPKREEKDGINLEFSDGDIFSRLQESTAAGDYVFPSKVLGALQQQLLQYFRTAMSPCRDQLERIYQYVGGHRGTNLQSLDETDDLVYWLREYCALVFIYISEPLDLSSIASSASLVSSSSIAWGGRSGGNIQQLDKTTLLGSNSVFGVACRMLTLEMEYDEGPENEPEGGDEKAQGAKDSDVNNPDSLADQATPEKARLDEASYRRFSAGLAIQSIAWRHIDTWRQEHASLIRSYDKVATTEWSQHVAKLTNMRRSPPPEKEGEEDTAPDPDPIQFLIQDRVVPFPDRAFLARVSPYFENLLMGDFRERYESQIRLQDVDPDQVEVLLEIIRESPMTSHHLLPPDLPLELVLKVMVCAERLMVRFVKRLAEKWVLEYLEKKETKYAVRCQASQERLRRRRQLQGEHGNKERRKRAKHDHDQSLNSTFADGVEQTHGEYTEDRESDDSNVDEDPAEETGTNENDDDGLSIQECLLMVYEACSIPQHGSIYQRDAHPFYGLVWDVLKWMVIRFGSVAAAPRFVRLLECRPEGQVEENLVQPSGRDEARIQELLQILFELVTNSVPE